MKPASPAKFPIWFAPAACGIAVAVALSVPIPFHGRLVNSGLDMCHAPVFALFAFLVFRFVADRITGPVILAKLVVGAVIVAIGAGTEAMQAFVGRQPSEHDVWANALGVLAGFCFHQRKGVQPAIRAGGILAGGLLIAAAIQPPLASLIDALRQRYQMPQVASFEEPFETSRWRASACEVKRVREHATEGHFSLRVLLLPSQYPAVNLEPAPNWASYDSLRLDVYLAGNSPLDLVVKIFDAKHDGEYDDRFNRVFEVTPGANELSISLVDLATAPVGRRMDMQRITDFSIFAVSLRKSRTIFLDNIRLE